MRLSSLSPKWVQLGNWSSPNPFYVGVSFLCPHCETGPCPNCGKSQGQRLVVNFWPPIDPAGMLGRTFDLPDNNGHRRTAGETFDALSLTPSIGFDNPPHFHGYITAGEVTNQLPNAAWAQALPKGAP